MNTEKNRNLRVQRYNKGEIKPQSRDITEERSYLRVQRYNRGEIKPQSRNIIEERSYLRVQRYNRGEIKPQSRNIIEEGSNLRVEIKQRGDNCLEMRHWCKVNKLILIFFQKVDIIFKNNPGNKKKMEFLKFMHNIMRWKIEKVLMNENSEFS